MSDKVVPYSNSKPKINVRGKNTKSKPKNNISSLTPNKTQHQKDNTHYNNKFGINHSTFLNNNNYNINNNISININIDMTNKQKPMNATKNKSQAKNNPIRIKKEDYKSNNSLIFNTLKHYTHKNNSKKSPFHIRIKSANIGLKDFKYNKNNNNPIIKKNFNVTNGGLNQKKSDNSINNNNNKTSIDQKNVSIDNALNNENRNNMQIKKDSNTISITTDHLNNDKKLFKNKSNQSNKPMRNNDKKRNNFSPTINRELLNRKQNIILNYSIGNRKNNANNKTIVNDNKYKTVKLKNNREVGSSPFIKGNTASLKKNNHISKDYSVNITNLLNKNQNYYNKKQIMNYKAKSPINNNKNELKNNKFNNIGKNVKNTSKNEFNARPQNVNKNIDKSKTNENEKSNDIKVENPEKENQKKVEESQKHIEENKKKEEENKLKANEEQKKKEEEGKNNNNEEVKKNEEKNLKEKEQIEKNIITKENAKKKKLNPSKSQNEISPNFLKNNLDENKNEEVNQNLKPSDLASKSILRMESICKKGFAGPGVKKTNQDNFFIYKNFLDSEEKIFLGVCDGHGIFGQDISGYLVNNLPQNLNRALLKENLKSFSSDKDFPQVSNVISLTFVQTNINLVNDDKVDSTFSGTTCSSLLFCPEKIISANVGDSRCVLGKFDGINWKAKNLTRDHKPSEEDEKKRILDKGGRIESYKDEEGEFVGPERVWLKTEDVPGLAMSRSFGDDIAHTVGVISQPEIFEYKFLNEDKFIMLASDGIWEFISSDECVNIVKDYYLKDDIEGALSYLYKESSKRWIMEEEVIDDITLIIMFLK